jgi:hypothetical protein
VTLGCEPRGLNTELATFLEPTPDGFLAESPYTLSGTIVESGTAGPLAGVLVDALGGRTRLTNESGFFEFQRLGRADVYFSKEGFESPGPFRINMNRSTTITTGMQRTMRASANQVLTTLLFPNDPYFNLGGEVFETWTCGPPCKLVRIDVPFSGRLRARVAWQPSGGDFNLLLTHRVGSSAPPLTLPQRTSGGLTQEIAVTGGTEALVYFGLIDFDEDPLNGTGQSAELEFTLTMSISP